MIHTAIKMINENLSHLYSVEEIGSFTTLIFEHVFGMSRIKIHLHRHDHISEAKLTEIKEIVERLQNFEPIQYITEETEFFGIRFKVNPAVLIPRPETEELVDWILKNLPLHEALVLDIGTGSGCIPISLAKNRPDLTIEAWDISEESLSIARENAKINQVSVNFSKVDILKWKDLPDNKFDVIISNPPYVTRSEQELMFRNVTDHEPHLALFVPDDDPLLFYNEIASFSVKYLNVSGILYLEINERFGNDLVHLLEKIGFHDVQIRKDINGKDRMIRGLVGER